MTNHQGEVRLAVFPGQVAIGTRYFLASVPRQGIVPFVVVMLGLRFQDA